MKRIFLIPLITIIFLAGSPIETKAHSFALDRLIVNTQSGFLKDIKWLHYNFNERDDRSWLVLADIYIKCKWLERYRYNGTPITYCFSTSDSEQLHWLGFIHKNKKFFIDHQAGDYVVGDDLKQAIWN